MKIFPRGQSWVKDNEYNPEDKEIPELTDEDFIKGWAEYLIANIRLKYDLI